MRKTKILLPVTLSVLIVTLLGRLLFACNSSSQQERQITNAFTPGKTQETILQPETSEEIPTQTESAVIPPANQSEPTAEIPVQPTMVVTNTQGLPIIVTQTRAATQPNQPANTAMPTQKPATNTATATQKPSNTPTPTKTLTPTVTMQTGWEGEWTFYLGDGTGGYQTGTLNITVNGKEVLGEAVIDGSDYEFMGELNSDDTFVMGDYTNGTKTGWFSWVFLSDSQFGGMLDNRLAFCASRNGAERPGQCGHFVIS